MNESFLSIAYRWGDTNGHHYVIYVGQDEQKAVALASAECADRAGKYGCLVQGWKDAGPEQEYRRVAYFKASRDNDNGPAHNYRIDMFQSLGHRFADFCRGTVYLPEDDPTMKDRDGNPTRVLKPHKVEVPKWATAELKRAEEICEAMSKFQQVKAEPK